MDLPSSMSGLELGLHTGLLVRLLPRLPPLVNMRAIVLLSPWSSTGGVRKDDSGLLCALPSPLPVSTRGGIVTGPAGKGGAGLPLLLLQPLVVRLAVLKLLAALLAVLAEPLCAWAPLCAPSAVTKGLGTKREEPAAWACASGPWPEIIRVTQVTSPSRGGKGSEK